MEAIGLGALDDEGAEFEAVRVCACGHPCSGDAVRCPVHGVVQEWGVKLSGELVVASRQLVYVAPDLLSRLQALFHG